MITEDLSTRVQIYITTHPFAGKKIVVHPKDFKKESDKKAIAAEFPEHTFKVLGCDETFSHEDFLEQAEAEKRRRLSC